VSAIYRICYDPPTPGLPIEEQRRRLRDPEMRRKILADTPSDAEIKSGRVGVGGFAPAPENSMDATIIQFRAWARRTPR